MVHLDDMSPLFTNSTYEENPLPLVNEFVLETLQNIILLKVPLRNISYSASQAALCNVLIDARDFFINSIDRLSKVVGIFA